MVEKRNLELEPENRSMVLAVEELARVESLYGQDWREVALAVNRFRRGIQEAKKASAPEDYQLADATCRLLEKAAWHDRYVLFHRELEVIKEHFEEESWGKERLGRELSCLGRAYLMNDLEFLEEVEHSQLARDSLSSIPDRTYFYRGAARQDMRARFNLFSNVLIETNQSGIRVDMEPVHNGGIDSVAYTVREYSVKVSGEKPAGLEIDVISARSFGLYDEIRKHPQVALFMKKELAGAVNLYRQQPEIYLQRRSDGSPGDPLQIDRALLGYLANDYLKSYLSPGDYLDFKKALSYADSEQALAAIGLRVMVEQFVDEGSRLRRGWYAKNHPEELQRVVEQAEDTLVEFGCLIEDGQVSNFFEMVKLAAGNKKMARRINRSFDKIFKGGHKSVIGNIRDEIERASSRDQKALYLDIFRIALEISRGEVVVEAGSV